MIAVFAALLHKLSLSNAICHQALTDIRSLENVRTDETKRYE